MKCLSNIASAFLFGAAPSMWLEEFALTWTGWIIEFLWVLHCLFLIFLLLLCTKDLNKWYKSSNLGKWKNFKDFELFFLTWVRKPPLVCLFSSVPNYSQNRTVRSKLLTPFLNWGHKYWRRYQYAHKKLIFWICHFFRTLSYGMIFSLLEN